MIPIKRPLIIDSKGKPGTAGMIDVVTVLVSVEVDCVATEVVGELVVIELVVVPLLCCVDVNVELGVVVVVVVFEVAVLDRSYIANSFMSRSVFMPPCVSMPNCTSSPKKFMSRYLSKMWGSFMLNCRSAGSIT